MNCPRCNSDQISRPQQRAAKDGPWLEVFIKCSKCRWQTVYRHTTPLIEAAIKRERKWIEARDFEYQRYGNTSFETVKKLRAAAEHRGQLQKELMRKIESVRK